MSTSSASSRLPHTRSIWRYTASLCSLANLSKSTTAFWHRPSPPARRLHSTTVISCHFGGDSLRALFQGIFVSRKAMPQMSVSPEVRPRPTNADSPIQPRFQTSDSTTPTETSRPAPRRTSFQGPTGTRVHHNLPTTFPARASATIQNQNTCATGFYGCAECKYQCPVTFIGTTQALTRSYSTRIAEVENPGRPANQTYTNFRWATTTVTSDASTISRIEEKDGGGLRSGGIGWFKPNHSPDVRLADQSADQERSQKRLDPAIGYYPRGRCE